MLGATAGILYGVAATLMKPVVEDLHDVGVSGVLESWEVWVMAIGGLVGFYLQQLSLATGKLVTSVATVSVANPVVSVSSAPSCSRSGSTGTRPGTRSRPSVRSPSRCSARF